MKLIYISNARIPTSKAHGYQICKMCEEFSSQGVEVELWLSNRTNEIKQGAFGYYGLKNNFKVIKIKSLNFLKYWNYLGKLSYWLHVLSFAFKLLFIKIDKLAVIYTREPEIASIFILRGRQVFFEAHSWPESKNWLYGLIIRRAKVIAITQNLADEFLKHGSAKNNLTVAPDGVDLNQFDINLDKKKARVKLGLPLDKKIALYTGHLYDWKGAFDLAKAAERLSAGYLAVFVGGVEADAKIFKERNRRLIETGKIVHFPHQSHEQMPVWQKAADVLILPNKSQGKISKYYTSPLKLFEYMASHRPIVASDLPSIREVLNENNCCFFLSDKPEDLAEKIKLVLNDGGLVEKITGQAYEDVKKYTWEKRAERIIKFIKLR